MCQPEIQWGPQAQGSRAVLVADGLMILTFLLMLAGLVRWLRLGYVSLDITTVVWVIVMIALLLLIVEPWPRPHAYW
jgi:hypothetical protein